MEEIWKVVEGFGGIYFVSNLGRVMSKARIQVYSDGRIYTHKDRVLKQSLTSSGYPIVHFYSDDSRKTLSVHRLVAEAFIENAENKPCVNHINGIKTDNAISNLEWMTYAENNAHALDTGLKEQTPSNYRSKLSKLGREARRDIIDNCKLGVEGFTAVEFAKKYGVAAPTIIKALRKGLDD